MNKEQNITSKGHQSKSIPIFKRVLATFTSTTSVNTAELKVYFQEPVVADDEDILNYWKENRMRFPILSSMAKDFLSMMPTSVSSERAFSLAGLTITSTRTNLNPNSFNETICLFSWFKTFGNFFKIKKF